MARRYFGWIIVHQVKKPYPWKARRHDIILRALTLVNLRAAIREWEGVR